MAEQISIYELIANASLLVQVVMGLLVLASIISWMMIFQRWIFLRRTLSEVDSFEDHFWSGIDLRKFFNDLDGDDNLNGQSGADVLAGNNGNDRMIGGAGNDALIDGLGSDIGWGGAGDDVFFYTDAALVGGTSGQDSDVFVGGAGVDTLFLVVSDAQRANAEAVINAGITFNQFRFDDLGLRTHGVEQVVLLDDRADFDNVIVSAELQAQLDEAEHWGLV